MKWTSRKHKDFKTCCTYRRILYLSEKTAADLSDLSVIWVYLAKQRCRNLLKQTVPASAEHWNNWKIKRGKKQLGKHRAHLRDVYISRQCFRKLTAHSGLNIPAGQFCFFFQPSQRHIHIYDHSANILHIYFSLRRRKRKPTWQLGFTDKWSSGEAVPSRRIEMGLLGQRMTTDWISVCSGSIFYDTTF